MQTEAELNKRYRTKHVVRKRPRGVGARERLSARIAVDFVAAEARVGMPRRRTALIRKRVTLYY